MERLFLMVSVYLIRCWWSSPRWPVLILELKNQMDEEDAPASHSPRTPHSNFMEWFGLEETSKTTRFQSPSGTFGKLPALFVTQKTLSNPLVFPSWATGNLQLAKNSQDWQLLGWQNQNSVLVLLGQVKPPPPTILIFTRNLEGCLNLEVLPWTRVVGMCAG